MRLPSPHRPDTDDDLKTPLPWDRGSAGDRGADAVRAVYDQAAVGIVAARADGRLFAPSRGFCRLVGYAADELERMTADDLTHRDDRAADRDQALRVLAGEADSYSLDKRFVRKDGTVVWVTQTATLIRPADEDPYFALAVVRDSSDRRRAADALRESEERYRRLADDAPDIIYRYRLGPERGYDYINPAVTAVKGYTPEEHYADPDLPLKIIHPDDRGALEALLRDPAGYPGGQLRWRHKDGRVVWTEQRVVPVRGPDGAVVAIEGVARDVTHQKQQEEQYRQARKMEAVGRLAGGVAHDFNNLLTVINGYGDVALGTLPEGHPARDMVREIRAAGERAAALTRQLLAFSRKQPAAPRVIDPNALVRDMDRMLRRLIGEDVEYTTVTDPGLWPVSADSGHLEQVVVNLIVNARDAMPDGGKLTVETRNVVLDEDYARAHADARPGPHVLVAVTDTGVGMDPATRDRAFDPFFTTKEPGKGTGLGLATVYMVVQQAGGHVALYSEPGRGTTVKVYLPPADEPAAAADRTPPRPMPQGSETLLLVEDDDAVRALARHVLAGCGYAVLEAADGREAVQVGTAHPGPIDLLVTDVVMPHLGGREVAERLVGRYPGLRVLFLSGYTDDAVVRHGLVDRAVAFLQKPFTPSDLAHKVREVLDRPAPGR